MSFHDALKILESTPRTWLITGVAGFIGSNLLETLLTHRQTVVGLDNFSTGFQHNLDMVRDAVPPEAWARFRFVKGDICDPALCRQVVTGVDAVLHHAALGSVPCSIAEPLVCNAINVSGFLNMLVAARDAGVKSFVYAASSATYGDDPNLPKIEDVIGNPLSPYAVTKYMNELYADVFTRCYGFSSIGLRYFNVFGPRQDPNGAYAAVMPLWFAGLLRSETIHINGDGETSRDFCFIRNVVQANILAALAPDAARGRVYNIALGQRTTLNALFKALCEEVSRYNPAAKGATPVYRDFRPGDVRHSQADISRAQRLLGYAPEYDLREGLRLAGNWYALHV